MNTMYRTVNMTKKPITEFGPGDTIYITKMVSGFTYKHLCRFVSFERGMVTGEVESFEPEWAYHQMAEKKGFEVRARLSKCFLWGSRDNDIVVHHHCQWFDSKTKRVKDV